MNARPSRLILLVFLVIVSAHAGVLTDISGYTNTGGWPGFDTPQPSWTLVIMLFDSDGAVTDISIHDEVTSLDLPTTGLGVSYSTSTTGGAISSDGTLGNSNAIEAPAIDRPTSSVPEPSTAVFLALGTAAVLWLRRR